MREIDKIGKVAAYILVIGLFIYLMLNSLGDGGRSILSWMGWIAFGLIGILALGMAWADRHGY